MFRRRHTLIGKNLLVNICGSLAALIVGGVFFFDIIGVFGLSLAITGLLVFVIGSLAVFRFTSSKGVPQ